MTLDLSPLWASWSERHPTGQAATLPKTNPRGRKPIQVVVEHYATRGEPRAKTQAERFELALRLSTSEQRGRELMVLGLESLASPLPISNGFAPQKIEVVA